MRLARHQRRSRRTSHFNPRTPCGVRRFRPARLFSALYFNPRTPCGVRLASGDTSFCKAGISIHAPLAGCDSQTGVLLLLPENFNPRTPCGVRHVNAFDATHPQLISIHAPLAGCDPADPVRAGARIAISIHAPLAGCDGTKTRHGKVAGHFNPRTPCGVRPIRPRDRLTSCNFNPRTPCGVRQQNCRNIPGKFAQKLQNFCKAEQRAALPRVGQRESGRYFRPCAVRTSRGKPERFRFASDNERALRSVARLCAEVLDAGFILVSKVIKA